MKPFSWILKAVVVVLCIGWIVSPLCLFALDARYKVILAKNPFDPDRGAGANGTEIYGGSDQGGFASKFAVYGVVIAGNSKYAFLKPVAKAGGRYKVKNDEGLRKVTVGDLVDGWKVKEIKSEGVLFVKAGKSEFLRVFGSTKKERSSTKPVAVATPRPKLPHPSPKAFNKNRPTVKREGKTEVFVVPDGKNKKDVKNSFLKALMDLRKRKQAEQGK